MFCGRLNAPEHRDLRDIVNIFLRMDPKYEKPEKPFPDDPRYTQTERAYVYWKRSPRAFELYAATEIAQDPGSPFAVCGEDQAQFSYHLRSVDREPDL